MYICVYWSLVVIGLMTEMRSRSRCEMIQRAYINAAHLAERDKGRHWKCRTKDAKKRPKIQSREENKRMHRILTLDRRRKAHDRATRRIAGPQNETKHRNSGE